MSGLASTTWSHSTTRASQPASQPSSSSTAPSLTPTTRGIDIGGWSIRVTSGPIGSYLEMDALSDLLGIPPPEMAFPHNSLVLQHSASGFSLCFDAVRTLRCVDGVLPENRLSGVDCRAAPSEARVGGGGMGAKPKGKGIKVAYAKEWGKSRSEFVGQSDESGPSTSHFGTQTDITAAKEYDWTYSTTWPGSVNSISPQPLLPPSSSTVAPSISPSLQPLSTPPPAPTLRWFEPGTDPSRDRIPVERLGPSSGEPILFYDDIVLFEDELADNGSSMVNVKVRVMPSGFLVLQRFFLRVDDVVFRVFDTRLYCGFEPERVARPFGKGGTGRGGGGGLEGSLAQMDLGTARTAKARDGDVVMSTDGEEAEEQGFVPRLIRECSGTSASYSLVRSHLPSYKPHDLSPLTDVNWVYSTLTKISRTNQTRYHAGVASGHLPSIPHTEANTGAKYISPFNASSTPLGVGRLAGTRPGERVDLSPAKAPGAEAQAQIVGELQEDESEDGWMGNGAVVHVAVLKAR